MSEAKLVSLTCPSCGKDIQLETHTSINRQTEPELAARLFDGSLFMQACPECEAPLPTTYPCVYNDMENRCVVNLVGAVEAIPAAVEEIETAKAAAAEMGELAAGLSEVRYRVVTNPFDLQEKAFIFDAGLDDRAIEFVKTALFMHLASQLHGDDPMIVFAGLDENGELMFETFDGEYVGTVNIPRDMYDEMAPMAQGFPTPADYVVNQAWARACLDAAEQLLDE
jgi:hypothetical protein